MQHPFVPLNIASYWDAVQNDVLAIVDLVPKGQMGYSAHPGMWNFQGLLMHVADARETWLTRDIRDGARDIDIWKNVRSREEIRSALEQSYARLQAFLANKAQLDAQYHSEWRDFDGHWVAFHLLEHDIHHRADMLHHLAMLDIDCSSMSFQ
jgi:uncharacterized damage-inducible protein DinB